MSSAPRFAPTEIFLHPAGGEPYRLALVESAATLSRICNYVTRAVEGRGRPPGPPGVPIRAWDPSSPVEGRVFPTASAFTKAAGRSPAAFTRALARHPVKARSPFIPPGVQLRRLGDFLFCLESEFQNPPK